MSEQMIEIIRAHHPSMIGVGLILLLSVIEVSKIQINPWSAILRWIGKRANKDIIEQNAKIITELAAYRKEFEDKVAMDCRWAVLTFANSCRQHERHSREEWQHALNAITKYEEYCEKHNIANAVIVEDSRYIREAYRTACDANDFLV